VSDALQRQHVAVGEIANRRLHDPRERPEPGTQHADEAGERQPDRETGRPAHTTPPPVADLLIDWTHDAPPELRRSWAAVSICPTGTAEKTEKAWKRRRRQTKAAPTSPCPGLCR